MEWDSWLSDVYGDRKFQSTVVGVDAAYLSGRALLERFTSDASKNFINFSNEEYDKLYQQVKKSTDDEEQTELYKRWKPFWRMMRQMSTSRIWHQRLH
ncbi:MAG: hypothetical protein ACLRMZ_02850 [Blautia marasmi]